MQQVNTNHEGSDSLAKSTNVRSVQSVGKSTSTWAMQGKKFKCHRGDPVALKLSAHTLLFKTKIISIELV